MTTEVTDPQTVAATAPPGGPAGAPNAVQPTEPAKPGELITTPATTVDPANVSSTTGDDGVVTYEATGDVALDLAMEFFGKLGLSFDNVEMQEAAKGNFSYLEAKLSGMGDKAAGFDRYIGLAKEAQGRAAESAKAKYEANLKTAHDAVGGKEVWDQVREYVGKNSTPELKAEFASAMDKGGVVATAMAQYLHRQVLEAQGSSLTGREAVSGDTPSAAATTGGPITREQYRELYKEGLKKYGMGFSSTPEHAALAARVK